MVTIESVLSFDEALSHACEQERARQEAHIELIASENYASPRVMALQGSVLTNKYAEGYPGKRYYGGCEFVDQVERLAMARACELFSAEYANVQPHSGSQANAVVYQAILQPGDTILAMDLPSGGHLTHGSSVNFSGKLYNAVHYGLDDAGQIDYEQVAELAQAHQPKLIVAGFSAYSLTVDWQRFRDIADSVSAVLMVDMAHISGLVAGGVIDSPIPYADVVTSTTHKTLRGPRSGIILAGKKTALCRAIDSALFPGMQGGPLMHVIAAKAMSFYEAMQPGFKDYQLQVLKNANTMVQVLQSRHVDIVSGRTENHMFTIDCRAHDLTGKTAEAALAQVNITVNKNMVPNDPQSPFVTSGIRIGTPAVTTRGFAEAEVTQLAHWIADVLQSPDDKERLLQIRQEIAELTARFPVYPQSACQAASV